MMFRHAALAPWARRCRQALGALLTVTLAGLASAQAEHAADSAAHATTLPPTVRAALAERPASAAPTAAPGHGLCDDS